jgi:hypothetical protein
MSEILKFSEAEPKEDYSPILALSIFDSSTLNIGRKVVPKSKLLVTVRDPKTNFSHPNVVSVPTQRIPDELFSGITKNLLLTVGSNDTFSVIDRADGQDGQDEYNFMLRYVLSGLISEKLGVEDDLNRHILDYTVTPWTFVYGKTFLLNGSEEDNGELIKMINLKVEIEKGRDLFPGKTASYSQIGWVMVEDFIRATGSHFPGDLGSGWSNLDWCIHGLCILSSKIGIERDLRDSRKYIENLI